MSDLTPAFDGLLKQHEAPPTRGSFDIAQIDEFLKEAYKINAHIAALHTQLLSVRQAYLSTAQPRKTPTHISSARRKQERPQPLTDQERDDIDAKAKSLLRELNGQIHALEGAETLRLETETALLRKRFAPRFGRALGAWAAGADGSLVAEGAGNGGKGAEQIAAERGAEQLKKHREGVLWLLKLRLERCGQVHTAMSQVRLTRQVEQARSVLAKTGGPSYADFAAAGGLTSQEGLAGSTGSLRSRALIEEEEREKQRRLTRDDDFTPEELQVFAKGNHDMLQHYETTLDKVKTAQQSLLEISEIQTMLADNLTAQSAHIEQLVEDSYNTADNIGGGNKQLKKAAQRGSPARMTFFAASGLCAFLILWDLII